MTMGILAALASPLPVAGEAAGGAPMPSIFDPVSPPAYAIRELSWLVLGICAAIFAVVGGIAAYCIARFRRRPGDDDREPPQVYGSQQIEVAWTVVPFIIVVVLFLATARYIYGLEGVAPGPRDLRVGVVGHQWWWEIRYPELGIVTANELHVPVSDPASPTRTFLTLETVDVIHSFWIPQVAGKMDLIPNRANRLWIEPQRAGTFVGQCAEYCGTQHAGMLLRVVVHPPEDFARWVAEQQAPARDDPAARAGRELFASLACISCHTVRGTPANGVFGPDLTHLMSRATIASGVAPNTPEHIRTWVNDPAALKPGALMPAMKVSREQLDALTAYLVTLR
jgi:cytochrome c oxidase subunit 2